MKICVSDIETDGLLDDLTKLYCAVIKDKDGSRLFTNLNEYLEALDEYDRIYFHNGFKFDLPALQKLSGKSLSGIYAKSGDTLVLSRLLYTDLADRDASKRRRYRDSYALPTRLTGAHSLGAWGFRLGNYKGDFNPANYQDSSGNPCTWANVGLNQDMLDYCEQDGEVTWKLLVLLLKKIDSGDWERAVAIENGIALLMAQQERNGFPFDENAAERFYADLAVDKMRLTKKLQKVFKPWYASNGETIPKKTICYKDPLRADLTEGAKYTKLKRLTFNPSSRHHAIYWLKKLYKWEPREFTESGQPKIDGDVLKTLDYPEANLLREYYDIIKIIGMLGDGDNAWLKLVKGGKIHGSVNPNGAGTGRATHSYPNLAQIPKGKKGSLGHACRTLFVPPDGWVLLGTDASGLELRCLGNALGSYDRGKYAEEVVNGDVHWANVLALGLVPSGTVRDKSNPEHEAARDKAKRWIYAFLYGAGDELLGEIAGFTEEERIAWREARMHVPVINSLKRRFIPVTVTRVGNILKGRELRDSFIKAIPAAKKFQDECKRQHKQQKCVIGLDGRPIYTRSAHSAPNFKLQGDGALVCKLWGIYIEEMCQEAGLKHGWDGDYAFCVWVHDEYQIACRNEEIAHQIGKIAQQAIHRVAETFGFICPLDSDYDIGSSWAETH